MALSAESRGGPNDQLGLKYPGRILVFFWLLLRVDQKQSDQSVAVRVLAPDSSLNAYFRVLFVRRAMGNDPFDKVDRSACRRKERVARP